MTVSSRAALIDDLKRMVVEECDKDIEPSAIGTDEQLIGGDLDLDSLDALQIAVAVKASFGVRIEGGPEGRRALASIASLADFIIEMQGKAE